MGFHIFFIAVQKDNLKDSIELLKNIGYPNAQLASEPDDGSASPFIDSDYVHIGEKAGWSLIWGNLFPPLAFYENLSADEFKKYKDFEFLASGFEILSAQSKLLACVIESTSGSYGYDWYVDGKLIRSYWEAEGESYKQYGELLPGEAEILSNLQKDESAILSLIEKLVIPTDELESLNYKTLKILWPEANKKSKFKFW